MRSVSIQNNGGVPRIAVDGKVVAPLSYITYFSERNCYADFADRGYRVFSFPIMFGDQPVNNVSRLKPFTAPLFPAPGKTDFAVFDTEVQKVLDACPEALLLPRVNVSPALWWEQLNPDDCCETGYPEGTPPRVCFSSRKFIDDTSRMLEQLLEHIKNAPYCDNILGCQIAAGRTEEWFGFDEKGSVGKTAREAFAKQNPGKAFDQAAFQKYLSAAAADAIEALCRVVKQASDNRWLAGAFYGYSYFCFDWKCNHLAMQQILASPHVDFVCSPLGYTNRKKPELDWLPMIPYNSVIKHGKIYFAECDVRTHLTCNPGLCRPGCCPPGSYGEGVWSGPDDQDVCIGALQAVFSRQLTSGYCSWWFDMWGKWFDSPGMMQEMERFHKIISESLADKEHLRPAEIAFFVDTENFTAVPNCSLLWPAINASFTQSGSYGTPLELYETADFFKAADALKVCVFFSPCIAGDTARAIEYCKEHNIKYIFFDGTQSDPVTREDILPLCAENKVHLFSDTADPVYVSKHYIALHASESGKKKLLLEEPRRVTPLFGCSLEPFTGGEIVFELEKYQTALFRLD